MIVKLSTTAALAACACLAGPAPSPAFLKHWKSGLAELASYEVTTARYGEPRKAQAVLVYVYEEIDSRSRIKVESDRVPPARRVPVLKLNHVLKFNTGVYDYSVMTSVFAGLEGPGVGRFLEPRKVSFSSQEWCGQVFHMVTPGPKGLASEIHSYFEAEGDAAALIPYPAGKGPAEVFYEDEMPILVRELDGEFLAAGESREIDLLPGLWERRKRHVPLALAKGELAKAAPAKRATRLGEIAAVTWTLRRGGATMRYHVEAAPPRRLLGWEGDGGEKGELIASLRDTYWEHNRNADLPLRKKLGLVYGMGE